MTMRDLRKLPWVLLPGLDGNGELFADFLRLRPGVDARVVSYPHEAGWRIDDYVAHVESVLRGVGPCRLIAESFSGPIALRLHGCAPQVAGVVFVASFAGCPNPWLRAVPIAALGATLRDWVTVAAFVRRMCLDCAVPLSRVLDVQRVVRALPIEVLRSRLCVLRDLGNAAQTDEPNIPWLALEARHDRLVTKRFFAPGSSGATVVIAGPHFLLQARPEACWRVIEEWLSGREIR